MDTGLLTQLVHAEAGDVLVVYGDIDITSAGDFEQACVMASMLSPDLVLDLAEVGFMDSSGVKVLVELQRRRSGRAPKISHASPNVARVFEVLGLAETFLERTATDTTSCRAAHGSARLVNDDQIDTYLSVLSGIGHPDRLIPLFSPMLTVEDDPHGGTPWGRDDLITHVRSAYEAGVRGEVVTSDLAGNWMVFAWRTSVPDGAEGYGVEDGGVYWRMLELHDGTITHIRRYTDREQAAQFLTAPI